MVLPIQGVSHMVGPIYRGCLTWLDPYTGGVSHGFTLTGGVSHGWAHIQGVSHMVGPIYRGCLTWLGPYREVFHMVGPIQGGVSHGPAHTIIVFYLWCIFMANWSRQGCDGKIILLKVRFSDCICI